MKKNSPVVLVGQPELLTKLSKILSAPHQAKNRDSSSSVLFADDKRDRPLYSSPSPDRRYDGPEIFTKEAVEAIWHYSEERRD
jgi:hypothetical protein